jgi:N-acetylmuramoyl-L-alanine amidase
VLDAGHGLGNTGKGKNDPGAVAHDTTEHLEAVALRDRARDRLRGLDVSYVPNDNTTLAEKARAANALIRNEGDVFLSLHFNSSGNPTVSGVEVYYDGERPYLAPEAARIAAAYAQATGLPNRGALPDNRTKRGDNYIVSTVKGRAFLIEVGFLSNKHDLDNARTKGADGIAAVASSVFPT